MDENEKKQLVIDASQEVDGKKRITCTKAFAVHKEHDISLKEIGELCNRNKIKVKKCQLGCF